MMARDTLHPELPEGRRIGFLIPGEPTDGFLSQIAMFDLALRHAPAPICDARLIAYLANDRRSTLPERWRAPLNNVEARFVPSQTEDHPYGAHAARRFAEDDPDLDIVILSDADTMVLGDLRDVLRLLAQGFPVTGVIANSPPFKEDLWANLSTRLTGRAISQPYFYTLMDPATAALANAPRAPFYANHGFLAFRGDALRQFSAPYLKMRMAVTRTMERPFFAGQIAMALTVHALEWHGVALPMRYNFPNDDRALALHRYEAQDVRILHYLRERNYHRSELFASRAGFEKFVQKPPDAADQTLYQALMHLTGGDYPF